MAVRYDPEIADEICDRLATGETLASITRDDHMPNRRSVTDWRHSNAAFRAKYDEARDIGHDAIAEEALRIADTPVEFEEVTHGPQGTTTKVGDSVGHRKLQVWARLQLLSAWNNRYRPSSNVKVSGDADNPLVVNDQSAATRLAELLARAEARKSRQGDDIAQDDDDYSDLV